MMSFAFLKYSPPKEVIWHAGGDPPPASNMMLKCECALHLAVDVVYSVLYGLDLFSSIIRDFDVEFFFKCHDQFNDIQGISAEVIDESGVDGDISLANAQLVNNDLLYTVKSAHYSFHHLSHRRQTSPCIVPY